MQDLPRAALRAVDSDFAVPRNGAAQLARGWQAFRWGTSVGEKSTRAVGEPSLPLRRTTMSSMRQTTPRIGSRPLHLFRRRMEVKNHRILVAGAPHFSVVCLAQSLLRCLPRRRTACPGALRLRRRHNPLGRGRQVGNSTVQTSFPSSESARYKTGMRRHNAIATCLQKCCHNGLGKRRGAAPLERAHKHGEPCCILTGLKARVQWREARVPAVSACTVLRSIGPNATLRVVALPQALSVVN